MNNVQSINDLKLTRKLSSTPLKVTTKREMRFGEPNQPPHTIIPVGTQVEVYFSEDKPSRMYFEYQGRARATMTSFAHKTFTGPFTKPPTEKTLWKYSDSGIARTVTGKKTEPDGTGPDGSPSWLLVLGLI